MRLRLVKRFNKGSISIDNDGKGMRVKRSKKAEEILEDVKEHFRYFKAVRRSVAKKPPRGRVKESIRNSLAESKRLNRQLRALISSRKKLETLEARLATRVRRMKRKSWGKVKKRRRRRRR